MTLHGALFTDFKENVSNDQFSLQGKKMLKVQMGYGPVWCRAGSMVGYQGEVHFEKKGSGLSKMVKSAVTGEGVDLMLATGQGELFSIWRHHAVFTDSRETMLEAEATHRDHAIVEQTFSDLKAGPLAHMPSSSFAAIGLFS